MSRKPFSIGGGSSGSGTVSSGTSPQLAYYSAATTVASIAESSYSSANGTLTWTAGAATSTNNIATVADSASNTGTGYLLSLSAAGSSAINGITIDRGASATGSRAIRVRDNTVEKAYIDFSGNLIAASFTNNGATTWTNAAAPGTPASGKTAEYADSTYKRMCGKDDAGNVACMGGMLLDEQDASGTFTGTGAQADIYTKSVPANTIGPGGCVRAEAYFTRNSGTGNIAFQWVFGATTIITYGTTASTVTTYWKVSCKVCNNSGVTNAQWMVADPLLIATSYTVVGGFNTGSNDTTGAMTFKLQANAASSEILNKKGWTITYERF